MFALKKILSSTGAYQRYIKTENIEPVLNVMPQIIISIRPNSSKNQKPEQEVAVKLAYQKYQIPFQPDDTVPIIICHGLLGAKNNWHSLAKALFESTYNRKVITLDARNHGDSPHTAEFSYDVMVCDLLKFLTDQNITKASFIGHSLGGRVCMLLSLLYPQFIHSLVVVDISPVKQSPNMLALTKIFNIVLGLKLNPKDSLSDARKQAASQLKEQIKDEQMISFLLTNLVEKKHSSQWRWKFNVNSISNNFESGVCKFPIPDTRFHGRTMFVAGTKSDYVRPEDEPGIKNIFPEAEFTYIEGAGHWVHADKPKEFLQVVTDFLKKDGPVMS